MVQQRDDVVLIDAAILGPPAIWEASGHLANFTDPLVDCTNCKQRFRLDKLDDPDTCPSVRQARHVHRGPPVQPDVQDPRRAGGGRRRRRLPAPGDGAGHVRQLRQRAADVAQEAAVRHRPGRQVVPQRDHPAELHLPHPRVRADGDGVLRAAGRGDRAGTSTGAPSGSTGTSTTASRATTLRLRPHDADELSHYSAGTSDVEFLFPWGFDELEGIAQRTDFDLRQHSAHSGERLDYFDQATDERYIPYVIEPAAGVTRTMTAFLLVGLRRGGGQRREAHRAAPAPPPRAVQGGGPPAVARRTR